MIDLSLTRAQMLEALNVPSDIEHVYVTDPRDQRLATAPVAQLVVSFHHRDDIFTDLKSVIKKRYGIVEGSRWKSSLLIPLQRAIGNSFKHGHEKMPDKLMQLDLIMTRDGAVVALSDQGAGFDVAKVYRKFQSGNAYFTFKGAGFMAYDCCKSKISFTDAGRTFLLLFVVGATSRGGGIVLSTP